MAYIDYQYYTNTFLGTMVTAADFPRLADRASDIIDAIAQKPVPMMNGEADENVKKATAYEVEVLAAQGGEYAITGFAEGLNAGSESLGSYSVSGGGKSGGASDTIAIPSLGGIPVSKLTISKLRAAGLMCRWAYAGVHDHGE